MFRAWCFCSFCFLESFAREKIHKNFGMNFHEWQDGTRFPKNKLCQIGLNQILQVHKFSQGWNIYMTFCYHQTLKGLPSPEAFIFN